MKRSKLLFVAFVLPAFFIYALFMLYPLISSLFLSMYKWDGFGEKVFVGFSNFARLFSQSEYTTRFLNALKNNTLFFIYTVLFQNVVALFLASLLNNRKIKGGKFLQSAYFMPTTLSIVIVGFIWTLIYNPIWGSLNFGLKAVGLKSWTNAWLGNEKYALISIAVANAWQYVGIPIMLFLAGMQSIPDDLYEATAIDGASSFQQFRKITFPLLAPVIFIMTTMVFVSNFSAFEIVYAMSGTLGAPNYSTDILGTYFYRTCFGQRLGLAADMGLGAAVATCMMVIIGLGIVVWFKFYGTKNTDLQ